VISTLRYYPIIIGIYRKNTVYQRKMQLRYTHTQSL